METHILIVTMIWQYLSASSLFCAISYLSSACSLLQCFNMLKKFILVQYISSHDEGNMPEHVRLWQRISGKAFGALGNC